MRQQPTQEPLIFGGSPIPESLQKTLQAIQALNQNTLKAVPEAAKPAVLAPATDPLQAQQLQALQQISANTTLQQGRTSDHASRNPQLQKVESVPTEVINSLVKVVQLLGSPMTELWQQTFQAIQALNQNTLKMVPEAAKPAVLAPTSTPLPEPKLQALQQSKMLEHAARDPELQKAEPVPTATSNSLATVAQLSVSLGALNHSDLYPAALESNNMRLPASQVPSALALVLKNLTHAVDKLSVASGAALAVQTYTKEASTPQEKHDNHRTAVGQMASVAVPLLMAKPLATVSSKIFQWIDKLPMPTYMKLPLKALSVMEVANTAGGFGDFLGKQAFDLVQSKPQPNAQSQDQSPAAVTDAAGISKSEILMGALSVLALIPGKVTQICGLFLRLMSGLLPRLLMLFTPLLAPLMAFAAPVMAVVAVVTALVGIFYLLSEVFGLSLESVANFFSGIVSLIGEGLSQAWDKLKSLLPSWLGGDDGDSASKADADSSPAKSNQKVQLKQVVDLNQALPKSMQSPKLGAQGVMANMAGVQASPMSTQPSLLQASAAKKPQQALASEGRNEVNIGNIVVQAGQSDPSLAPDLTQTIRSAIEQFFEDREVDARTEYAYV